MENEAFHFLVFCLPPRGQGVLFSHSLAPKIGWDRCLLLLSSRSLPFPLLNIITHLCTNWAIILEGSTWLFTSKV